MNIHIASEGELKAVFALRVEVFVHEQNVPPELELDDEDACALHVIAEQNGVTVGCARILFSEGEAHIGRLAVKKEYRGKGVGAAICRFVLEYCRERGYNYIWLNSQFHAKGFYQKLGFSPEGETFTEAGIEHVKMVFGC